jgi:hypothetical protein
LSEVVALLREETDKATDVRAFLMQALLYDLAFEQGLQIYVGQLERLLYCQAKLR